ncbi:MAG: protein-L-isoaspartate O-methyltransferase, partial [Betaproteobacteria bacterium AqS2]|nr:protein-L-isoaspartate O-methyltransferase [Betaproteobacteria bacterium AqS2]
MDKVRDISGGRLLAQDLRDLGIKDEQVLAAIAKVPRIEFLARSLAARARDNDALPIGHGQTTSQPWVIARMLELAQLDRGSSRVLEVGTGCGYQTAILTHLAREVYSVERIGSLLGEARKKL